MSPARALADDSIQPGTPRVRHERGGVDAPAHCHLVAGNGLVADDAEDSAGDSGADERRVAVLDQLADALVPGEGGTGPDDDGDAYPARSSARSSR
jgi:hypothetical protein